MQYNKKNRNLYVINAKNITIGENINSHLISQKIHMKNQFHGLSKLAGDNQ